MIANAPLWAGALQVTSTLLDEAGPTETLVGAPGGSSTFVTVIVTTMVSSIVGVCSGLPSPSSPSVTSTVTV